MDSCGRAGGGKSAGGLGLSSRVVENRTSRKARFGTGVAAATPADRVCSRHLAPEDRSMNAHDVAGCPVACDTEALNTLLRAELAAVESYDRAIPEFEAQPA